MVMIAYTEYGWDPRVRMEAETLAKDGYVVHAITIRPRSGPTPLKLGGVNVWELPIVARRGGRIRYLYQYATFLLLSTTLLLYLHVRHRFSLVHVHSLPDFQVFCALPLRLAGVPVLLDLHEALPEIIAARFHLAMSSLMPRLAAVLERLSCRFANHVITANDGVREAVVSRGTPSDHVTAVYNTTEMAPEQVSPEELRRDLRLPDAPLLVHAGGVNPERDLETLIRALTHMPNMSDLQVVVAGEGDPSYIRELRGLAASLGLDRRVHFVGRVTRAQARALMSLSEVGVITLEANPLTELAWPTRIVEYVALGKVLLVPKLRFLASILQAAAHYYFPGEAASLARALESILAAKGSPDPTTERARRICLRFGPERSHEELRNVYRHIEASNAG